MQSTISTKALTEPPCNKAILKHKKIKAEPNALSGLSHRSEGTTSKEG